MHTVQQVVIGVTGSAGSQAAIRWTRDQLAGTSAGVCLVHTLSPDDELLRDLPPIGFSNWRVTIRRQLVGAWSAPLRAAGIPTTWRLVDGNAAEVLLRVGDEVDADLIVVGTHGQPRFADRLMGSVGANLVRHTDRPVVTIPAGWREQDDAAAVAAAVGEG